MALPRMAHGDEIKKSAQTKFGGLNHNLYAGDGEIWDMENLTSDYYPLLSPRGERYRLDTLGGATVPRNITAMYGGDSLFWVCPDSEGYGLYVDGVRVGSVLEGPKAFTPIGPYVVILPDKIIHNSVTGELLTLDAAYISGAGEITFKDGTFAGEEAKANTVVTTGEPFPFRAGDAVTISGATFEANNKTPIVREMSEDNKTMIFYEHTFTLDPAGGTRTSYTDPNSITFERAVPDMDFLIENENRLWGCKGDTIYASKLGDPFNWNVFDGLATDSYAVDVGSAGDFTGAFSFLGHPVFFKEENIYKVYGSKPSNFQVMGSATLGVMSGSGTSLAVAGEVLFYLSRAGVVAYSGGMPAQVASAFGTVRYKNAVAGSDGIKYYISMQDGDGAYHMFVMDSRVNLWHREDNVKADGFTYFGGLHFLSSGDIWRVSKPDNVEGYEEEGPVSWSCTFGDFVEDEPNRKGVSKVQIRADGNLRVILEYDDGERQTVSELYTEHKRSYYLPIIPRRLDHYRVILEGTGEFKLYSLSKDYYVGSEL